LAIRRPARGDKEDGGNPRIAVTPGVACRFGAFDGIAKRGRRIARQTLSQSALEQRSWVVRELLEPTGFAQKTDYASDAVVDAVSVITQWIPMRMEGEPSRARQ
jgi:hypothetical protein